MKNLALFSLLIVLNVSIVHAQDISKPVQKPFYADLVMGPYLILDGTIYESVFLTGVRIGYECKSGIAFGVEYLAGNQEDLKGELGTTHSAFGNLKYFLIKNNNSTRFRPYLLSGGGFFEFKDFSSDVLGVAFYLGAGAEMNFSERLKGFVEPRYINLGLMDADGTNQLGVMWGIRARF